MSLNNRDQTFQSFQKISGDTTMTDFIQKKLFPASQSLGQFLAISFFVIDLCKKSFEKFRENTKAFLIIIMKIFTGLESRSLPVKVLLRFVNPEGDVGRILNELGNIGSYPRFEAVEVIEGLSLIMAEDERLTRA